MKIKKFIKERRYELKERNIGFAFIYFKPLDYKKMLDRTWANDDEQDYKGKDSNMLKKAFSHQLKEIKKNGKLIMKKRNDYMRDKSNSKHDQDLDLEIEDYDIELKNIDNW